MAGLRQVEIIAGRIVGAVAGERPVAGPLDDLDVGIFFRDLAADLVQVLHLDAEMIEAGLAAAAPRNERHADIAVADRNGADLARGVARRLQPEHGAIEHAEQRVVVAGDGEMIELAEHDGSLRVNCQINRPGA